MYMYVHDDIVAGRFLTVMIDTWKYRHVDMAAGPFTSSPVNRRSSLRRSMLVTSPHRHPVSPQMSVDQDEPTTAVPHSRRTTTDSSDIVRILNLENLPNVKKIKQRSIGSGNPYGGFERDLRSSPHRSEQPPRQRASIPERQTFLESADMPMNLDDDAVLGNVPMERTMHATVLSSERASDNIGVPQNTGSDDISRGTGNISTRVFEYDENGDLVEVYEENVGEGSGGDGDFDYDEEYIEVVYESDTKDDDDNEVHVVYEEPRGGGVASHITWL